MDLKGGSYRRGEGGGGAQGGRRGVMELKVGGGGFSFKCCIFMCQIQPRQLQSWRKLDVCPTNLASAWCRSLSVVFGAVGSSSGYLWECFLDCDCNVESDDGGKFFRYDSSFTVASRAY